MNELWFEFEAQLNYSDLNTHEILLRGFIGPIIKELERRDLLETFHFFFEPNFLLRMKPKSTEITDQIHSTIEMYLPNAKDMITPLRSSHGEYTGELEDYGEDGWTITKKVFELGSRMAIALADPNSKKGRKFSAGKLLHCFLNSLGYSIFFKRLNDRVVTREALHHLDEFIGRMLILRKKPTMDLEIESEIERLTKDQVSSWRGKSIQLV